MAEAPLSPQDRAKVFATLHANDPTLADRVATLLDDRDDPVLRLLMDLQGQQLNSQRDAGTSMATALANVQTQIQRLNSTVMYVSVLAMLINAGLVGVSISLNMRTGDIRINDKPPAAAPVPALHSEP